MAANDTYRDTSVLDEWTRAFQRISKDGASIDPQTFKECLGIHDDYLAQRLFSLFDEDGSGTIELSEFLAALSALLLGGREAKLEFAFKLHDRDGNGAIDEDELSQIISACLSEGELHITDEQTRALVNALFTEADKDGNGSVSFEEFKSTLEQYPQVYESMTLSAAAWLAPLRGEKRQRQPKIPGTHRYAENTLKTFVFLGIYAAINIALFVNAVLQYADHNIYVQIARGCGACLNFNGALILVPVMRMFITWLRRTWMSHVVPLDQHLDFHMLVGHSILAFSVAHTVAHLLNYSTLTAPLHQSVLSTFAGATGLALIGVTLIMWVCAQSFVRRSGRFELFFFSHLAFIVWLGFTLFHGPVFWQWLLLPGIGFGVERLLRTYRSSQPSYVIESDVLPGGVTHLTINRPPSFEYQPGDYVFVLMPKLSRYEWHPFTISSSPEQEVLTFHIRSLGNWTRALNDLCKTRADSAVLDPLTIHIEGPYGTPSTKVFESTNAVLIAAGIGVTPFASILRSVLRRQKSGGLDKLHRVHFYWVNRGQHSFEWFTQLLGELEKEDMHDLLDLNIYLSNALADLKATTLNIAFDLRHKQTGRDLITGLELRTRMGRPDWSAVFADLAAQHQGSPVDVYYCGPPRLSRILRRLAQQHDFTYSKENF